MVLEADLVKALNLKTIIAAENGRLNIEVSNVNRPGLQLAGYWDFFGYERPQLLGMVEMTYLSMLDKATRHERLTRFFSYDIPCIIIARSIPCFDEMLVLGAARKIPHLLRRAGDHAGGSGADLLFARLPGPARDHARRAGQRLRQRPAHHRRKRRGQERDGIELVKRGHQLVADDVVDIRRVADDRLVGESPELVRHFMEIRGVGIIDIATMYGVGAVIRSKTIDLEVKLENWQQGKEYDRLGLTDQYGEILGVKVPYILIPIHPGRNLAIVLEVAARNFRLKQMGYNAAQELAHRHMERAMRAQQEESEV